MKKTLMQKVTDSIFEVMETMFYLTVEERNDLGQDLSTLFDIPTLRACRISFSGEFSGSIFLMVPRQVLEQMTRNFMGDDHQALTRELTDGTLMEALNMIAGNALTRMNKESYTGLGIPEMIDPAAQTFDNTKAVFNTGIGHMAVCVEL